MRRGALRYKMILLYLERYGLNLNSCESAQAEFINVGNFKALDSVRPRLLTVPRTFKPLNGISHRPFNFRLRVGTAGSHTFGNIRMKFKSLIHTGTGGMTDCHFIGYVRLQKRGNLRIVLGLQHTIPRSPG